MAEIGNVTEPSQSPTLFASIGITNTSLYTGIYGLVKAIGSIIFYVYFVRLSERLSELDRPSPSAQIPEHD